MNSSKFIAFSVHTQKKKQFITSRKGNETAPIVERRTSRFRIHAAGSFQLLETDNVKGAEQPIAAQQVSIPWSHRNASQFRMHGKLEIQNWAFSFSLWAFYLSCICFFFLPFPIDFFFLLPTCFANPSSYFDVNLISLATEFNIKSNHKGLPPIIGVFSWGFGQQNQAKTNWHFLWRQVWVTEEYFDYVR